MASTSITGTYNITCYEGVTLKRSINWADSAKRSYDLTDFTAHMQVRPSDTSEEVLANLTTENGYIVLGSTKPNIGIHIPSELTANIPTGMYVYDLLVTAPNGEVDRLISGSFHVKPKVTK